MNMQTLKRYQKSRYLHSPAHVLADEISSKLNDKKHFGFYLKMALKYNNDVLRRIVGEVIESKSVKKPGALFAYLLKKYKSETNSDAQNPHRS